MSWMYGVGKWVQRGMDKIEIIIVELLFSHSISFSFSHKKYIKCTFYKHINKCMMYLLNLGFVLLNNRSASQLLVIISQLLISQHFLVDRMKLFVLMKMNQVHKINNKQLTIVNRRTLLALSIPAGISRMAVLGFFASNERSR